MINFKGLYKVVGNFSDVCEDNFGDVEWDVVVVLLYFVSDLNEGIDNEVKFIIGIIFLSVVGC